MQLKIYNDPPMTCVWVACVCVYMPKVVLDFTFLHECTYVDGLPESEFNGNVLRKIGLID